MSNSQKTVLVTGYQGYIGPVVVRQLKEHGFQVVGLDTGYFKDCHEPGSAIVPPDRQIVADIRDLQPQMFDGVDAVIHLAGLSNDPLGDVAGPMTAAINTAGTASAGKLAKEAGVARFIFASSCSIYGAAGNSAAPLDETAPFAPVSAYAHSKVDGEAVLLALKGDGFRPLMMRNATAYGVSPRTRLDLVVGNLLAHGIASGTIRVLSDGTPWRPLVHIEDIAAAAIAGITARDEDLKFDAYNIGRTDANHQVREIAEMVALALPGCAVEITGEAGNDPRSYRVNFNRAAEGLPGFAPQWALVRGIDQMRDWMQARGDNLGMGDLLSPRYVRLMQLRSLLDQSRIDGQFRWKD